MNSRYSQVDWYLFINIGSIYKYSIFPLFKINRELRFLEFRKTNQVSEMKAPLYI